MIWLITLRSIATAVVRIWFLLLHIHFLCVIVGSENKALQKDEEHEDNDNVEDYETWKTRILTEAYALINNIDAHSHENC